MAHTAFITIFRDHGFHFWIGVIDRLHAGTGYVNDSVFNIDRRIISCLDRNLPKCFLFIPGARRIVGSPKNRIGVKLVGDHIIQITIDIISTVRCKKADRSAGCGMLGNIKIDAFKAPVTQIINRS